MGIKVTKNTLARFSERLGGQNVDNLADRVAERLAQEGKKVAEFEYASSGHSDINVDVEVVGVGERRITASGDNVAYVEFGVGEYAKGTYQGKLPTQPLTFESPKGKTQTTNGWVYYYPNKDTKRTIGGQHGWFIQNGVFTIGHPAGNQLFYTAKSLRENETEIVKNALKGDKSK